MGFMNDLATGFMSGLNEVRARHNGGGLCHIEKLCRQLGWGIDERGEECIVLYFKDPLIGRRPLLVTGEKEMTMFTTWSISSLRWGHVPEEILGYLLERKLGMGAWKVANKEEKARFTCEYFALTKGLHAPLFKHISEKLVREASEFDQKMHNAHLLDVE